ncbi:hypothetical protein [Mycolicibacterium goodii]|nr:hypothetical protein [Mycolicibacterium goodii]
MTAALNGSDFKSHPAAPMDGHASHELLIAVLKGAPRLAGARCVGRPELFDPAAPDERPEDAADRHEAAVHLCRACPALAACRSWHDSLRPSQRPGGVIAARAPKPPGRPGRPTRKETA